MRGWPWSREGLYLRSTWSIQGKMFSGIRPLVPSVHPYLETANEFPFRVFQQLIPPTVERHASNPVAEEVEADRIGACPLSVRDTGALLQSHWTPSKSTTKVAGPDPQPPSVTEKL